MADEEEIIELEPYDYRHDAVDEATPANRWVRVTLLVLTVPWLIVFAIATQLDPYKTEDGQPLRMGTHKQLGLPECNFKLLVGVPCPSCGMTTSFTLLAHGDVWNSLQANFAGTVLAILGLLFVPWALASAFFGRFVFVRSIEMVIFRIAVCFLILLFGRWGIVLIVEWLMSK
jgi:hypothetical protein